MDIHVHVHVHVVNVSSSLPLSPSSLDLGLPLWLGGIPALAPVPAGGINACMRNLLINEVMIDLEEYVEEENSQNGCPQVT